MNTKEIKIDVTEADVVKEEAVGDDGDKQMDATAIEDVEADVIIVMILMRMMRMM